MARSGTARRLLVIAVGLLVPAAAASADGPVATKSGAVINFTSTAKLRVAKTMHVRYSCSVDCDVAVTARIKGPGTNLRLVQPPVSFTAGPVLFFIKPNKPLLKLMKAEPTRFRIACTIDGTDRSTGGTDEISHSFKVKR
jgi:hypothetical protein